MRFKQPVFRCSKNWDELAKVFNYKIDKHEQDWTYTIVENHRIDEYINAYDTIITNDDTKFSLMEMIIQSITDQPTNELMKIKWKLVKVLLEKDFELHKYTIYYWCSWQNKNINECWDVTPLMREFWISKIDYK